MKKILVILDGASGLPHKDLGGKTPIEAAKTPNLDYLTKNGKMGYMFPINEKIAPGSDNSLISLFGNDPKKIGRGTIEAIGLGVNLTRGDLALRVNFGTIENLKSRVVIDRRAGRTLTSKEALLIVNSLNEKVKIPCKFEFVSGVQHRGVLVLRGGFSENITSIDTEWSGSGKNSKKFVYSRPLDNSLNSKYTVNIINNIIDQVYRILENHPVNIMRKSKGLLPANMIFLRGPGIEIPKVKQYSKWMAINSMPLEVGIAKIMDMKNFSFGYPKLKNIDVYGILYKALNKKIKFVKKIIKKNHKNFEGCYIQFKETDVPGHDNKPYEKQNMMEILDKKFFSFLKNFAEHNKIKVVVSCDHSTPCKLKGHSKDPVPVLIYGEGKDKTKQFSEKQAKKGSLGKIYGKNFMKRTGLR